MENGCVIDSGLRGSAARFANHSCSPNSEMQKWYVNGIPRIGLFASESIPPGVELTYDYNFDWFEGAKMQVCLCGEANCRGYIGKRSSRRPTPDDHVDESALKKKTGRRKQASAETSIRRATTSRIEEIVELKENEKPATPPPTSPLSTALLPAKPSRLASLRGLRSSSTASPIPNSPAQAETKRPASRNSERLSSAATKLSALSLKDGPDSLAPQELDEEQDETFEHDADVDDSASRTPPPRSKRPRGRPRNSTRPSEERSLLQASPIQPVERVTRSKRKLPSSEAESPAGKNSESRITRSSSKVSETSQSPKRPRITKREGELTASSFGSAALLGKLDENASEAEQEHANTAGHGKHFNASPIMPNNRILRSKAQAIQPEDDQIIITKGFDYTRSGNVALKIGTDTYINHLPKYSVSPRLQPKDVATASKTVRRVSVADLTNNSPPLPPQTKNDQPPVQQSQPISLPLPHSLQTGNFSSNFPPLHEATGPAPYTSHSSHHPHHYHHHESRPHSHSRQHFGPTPILSAPIREPTDHSIAPRPNQTDVAPAPTALLEPTSAPSTRNLSSSRSSLADLMNPIEEERDTASRDGKKDSFHVPSHDSSLISRNPPSYPSSSVMSAGNRRSSVSSILNPTDAPYAASLSRTPSYDYQRRPSYSSLGTTTAMGLAPSMSNSSRRSSISSAESPAFAGPISPNAPEYFRGQQIPPSHAKPFGAPGEGDVRNIHPPEITYEPKQHNLQTPIGGDNPWRREFGPPPSSSRPINNDKQFDSQQNEFQLPVPQLISDMHRSKSGSALYGRGQQSHFPPQPVQQPQPHSTYNQEASPPHHRSLSIPGPGPCPPNLKPQWPEQSYSYQPPPQPYPFNPAHNQVEGHPGHSSPEIQPPIVHAHQLPTPPNLLSSNNRPRPGAHAAPAPMPSAPNSYSLLPSTHNDLQYQPPPPPPPPSASHNQPSIPGSQPSHGPNPVAESLVPPKGFPLPQLHHPPPPMLASPEERFPQTQPSPIYPQEPMQSMILNHPPPQSLKPLLPIFPSPSRVGDSFHSQDISSRAPNRYSPISPASQHLNVASSVAAPPNMPDRHQNLEFAQPGNQMRPELPGPSEPFLKPISEPISTRERLSISSLTSPVEPAPQAPPPQTVSRPALQPEAMPAPSKPEGTGFDNGAPGGSSSAKTVAPKVRGARRGRPPTNKVNLTPGGPSGVRPKRGRPKVNAAPPAVNSSESQHPNPPASKPSHSHRQQRPYAAADEDSGSLDNGSPDLVEIPGPPARQPQQQQRSSSFQVHEKESLNIIPNDAQPMAKRSPNFSAQILNPGPHEAAPPARPPVEVGSRGSSLNFGQQQQQHLVPGSSYGHPQDSHIPKFSPAPHARRHSDNEQQPQHGSRAIRSLLNESESEPVHAPSQPPPHTSAEFGHPSQQAFQFPFHRHASQPSLYPQNNTQQPPAALPRPSPPSSHQLYPSSIQHILHSPNAPAEQTQARPMLEVLPQVQLQQQPRLPPRSPSQPQAPPYEMAMRQPKKSNILSIKSITNSDTDNEDNTYLPPSPVASASVPTAQARRSDEGKPSAAAAAAAVAIAVASGDDHWESGNGSNRMRDGESSKDSTAPAPSSRLKATDDASRSKENVEEPDDSGGSRNGGRSGSSSSSSGSGSTGSNAGSSTAGSSSSTQALKPAAVPLAPNSNAPAPAEPAQKKRGRPRASAPPGVKPRRGRPPNSVPVQRLTLAPLASRTPMSPHATPEMLARIGIKASKGDAAVAAIAAAPILAATSPSSSSSSSTQNAGRKSSLGGSNGDVGSAQGLNPASSSGGTMAPNPRLGASGAAASVRLIPPTMRGSSEPQAADQQRKQSPGTLAIPSRKGSGSAGGFAGAGSKRLLSGSSQTSAVKRAKSTGSSASAASGKGKSKAGSSAAGLTGAPLNSQPLVSSSSGYVGTSPAPGSSSSPSSSASPPSSSTATGSTGAAPKRRGRPRTKPYTPPGRTQLTAIAPVPQSSSPQQPQQQLPLQPNWNLPVRRPGDLVPRSSNASQISAAAAGLLPPQSSSTSTGSSTSPSSKTTSNASRLASHINETQSFKPANTPNAPNK